MRVDSADAQVPAGVVVFGTSSTEPSYKLLAGTAKPLLPGLTGQGWSSRGRCAAWQDCRSIDVDESIQIQERLLAHVLAVLSWKRVVLKVTKEPFAVSGEYYSTNCFSWSYAIMILDGQLVFV